MALALQESSRGSSQPGSISRAPVRVLIAAGGTGGHLFPALAVAEALRSRRTGGGAPETAISFLGTGRGLEARVVPAAGFPLYTIAAAGLKGIGGIRKAKNFVVLPRSFWEAGKLLLRLRPQVVVGVGGYIAGPVLLEAALGGIPTLLIEPNVRPGFTNRALAPFIQIAALGFDDAAPFYGRKARVTGHPVRAAFSQVVAKEHTPPFTILIVGGSQGSRAINETVIQALTEFRNRADQLRLVHQTGERDFDRVSQAYRDYGMAAKVYRFVDRLPSAFAEADLVVSRSGASTVAELMAAGKASVLIPFPAATDDHQLANARVLEQAGAARVLEQRDLTGESLFKTIEALVSQPEALGEMDRRARALAHPEAAAEIAGLIEEIAG